MTLPARARGGWVFDQRGQGRGVRVSAHVDAGFLVLSTWKSDTCVATVRLLPDEAARLVSNIADGLASLAVTVPPELHRDADPHPDRDRAALAARLSELEARLALLEHPEA